MSCLKYILIIFILLLLLPPLLLLFFFCFIFVFSQNLRWFWPKLDTNLICYPTYENVLMGFRPKITFKYHLRKSKKMTVSSHKGFRSYLQKITRGGRISPPLWQLGLRVDVRLFCLLALCDFLKWILSIYGLKILSKVVHHLDILKQHQLWNLCWHKDIQTLVVSIPKIRSFISAKEYENLSLPISVNDSKYSY